MGAHRQQRRASGLVAWCVVFDDCASAVSRVEDRPASPSFICNLQPGTLTISLFRSLIFGPVHCSTRQLSGFFHCVVANYSQGKRILGFLFAALCSLWHLSSRPKSIYSDPSDYGICLCEDDTRKRYERTLFIFLRRPPLSNSPSASIPSSAATTDIRAPHFLGSRWDAGNIYLEAIRKLSFGLFTIAKIICLPVWEVQKTMPWCHSAKPAAVNQALEKSTFMGQYRNIQESQMPLKRGDLIALGRMNMFAEFKVQD